MSSLNNHEQNRVHGCGQLSALLRTTAGLHMHVRKILCVCEDSYTAELRCRVLTTVGYEPVAASVAVAFDLLAAHRFDAIVFAPQIDQRTCAALRNAAGADVKALHLRRGQAGNLLVAAVHALFQREARTRTPLKRSHNAG